MLKVSVFGTEPCLHSSRLGRGLSGLSPSVSAVLDFQSSKPLRLANAGELSSVAPVIDLSSHRAAEGASFRVDPLELAPADRNALQTRNPPPSAGKGRWLGFSCNFGVGRRDVLAMWLGQAEDPQLAAKMLQKLWPVLREDCLQEAEAPAAKPEVKTFSEIGVADEAFLWMISDRLDLAIFVLDAQSRMLRVNLAARRLLEKGDILRRGHGGLFAATDCASKALRAAVEHCAHHCDAGDETVVFLDSGGDRPVPITLTRFVHQGQAVGCVVAMLPMPPGSDRVEMVSRGMGLTPVEARVASLIQLGLSNREAAAKAGIREQTFNTYAKRALAKLNVSSRAEMAQILTWQAAGGPKT